MYRTTARAQAKRERFAAMGRKSQRVQAAQRAEFAQPTLFWSPPEVRRVITITDFDAGERTVSMELRRSDRIDCYDCYIDGTLWKKRIGWSRVQEWIRKAFPRIVAL